MTAWNIAHGDILSVLADYRDASFDALLCDPPYGFSFMGKSWDYDVPSVDIWRECLRVLKPGAPLVAFGGSRTYHRLACGVEDAGFELRDQLCWLYGNGFPKSLDVSKALDKAAGAKRPVIRSESNWGASKAADGKKAYGDYAGSWDITAPVTAAAAWQGYGTALKPAHEPIVLARRPLEGTVAQNVAKYGVGGLAIDACRIEGEGNVKWAAPRGGIWKTDPNQKAELLDAGGRWPANLILSHTEHCRPTGTTREVKNGTAVKHRGVVAGTGATFGIAKPPGTPDAGYGVQQVEVWECSEDCPIRLLDAEAGDKPSRPVPANVAEGNVLPFSKRTAGGYSDSGGPSRLFYCAKVSTKEREAGCEGLALKSAGECTNRNDYVSDAPWIVEGGEPSRPAGLDNPRAGAGRTGGARNHHPTLKPISLTTWLARLIMPPNPGVILVPFSGAGSEMIGCLKAGWSGVFGIEREEEYLTIARARLRHWCPESEAA